jgi:hypothetical protein
MLSSELTSLDIDEARAEILANWDKIDPSLRQLYAAALSHTLENLSFALTLYGGVAEPLGRATRQWALVVA